MRSVFIKHNKKEMFVFHSDLYFILKNLNKKIFTNLNSLNINQFESVSEYIKTEKFPYK